MLFDIVFEILALSILVMLFLCVLWLYRQLNFPEKTERKAPRKFFRKSKEQSKEEKRLNQILYNIDNYNGDELGQKEIEVK